ncbi:MAG TPA: hypothetical protein PLY91_09645, partial [Methanoregulaceae archaeon]|nr:hypothetical protein [Methanoregulaceae archaeon]
MTAPSGGSFTLYTPGRSEKEATVAGIARDGQVRFIIPTAVTFTSDLLVGNADPAVITIPWAGWSGTGCVFVSQSAGS